MADDLLGWLGDMLGLNKGQATKTAAGQNQQLLSDLNTQGTGYLTDALGNSQSLLDLANKGSGLYADALGVNGTDAANTARSTFQHSPGYQQALDEGEQAIMRSAAARGDLGGGGTSIDLMKYGVGAADQDWNNWLGNLSGYNNLLPTATSMTNGSLSDLLDFKSGITSSEMGANNQYASGAEAGQGGLWNLLQNVGGVAGSVIGLNNGLKTGAALDRVGNADDLAQLGRTTRYGSGGSFGGYGSYF